MPRAEREKQILRFLEEREAMFGPKALYDNLVEYKEITYSEKTVRRALIDMAERGLVERREIGRGYYQLSDRGRKYLAGELDEADDAN